MGNDYIEKYKSQDLGSCRRRLNTGFKKAKLKNLDQQKYVFFILLLSVSNKEIFDPVFQKLTLIDIIRIVNI